MTGGGEQIRTIYPAQSQNSPAAMAFRISLSRRTGRFLRPGVGRNWGRSETASSISGATTFRLF